MRTLLLSLALLLGAGSAWGQSVSGGASTSALPAAAQVAPTVTAGAYSAGTSIGGLLSLTSPGGLAQAVTVTFASGVEPSMDVVLFSAQPTSSTITDNAAVSIASADLPKVLGVVHITDCTLLGSSSPSECQGQQQAVPYVPAGSVVYAAVITRSAVTLGSTNGVTLTLQTLR